MRKGNPKGRPNPDWKPGVGGNPRGRPKGSLSKWSEHKLRKLLDIMADDAEAIIRCGIRKALTDGDKDQGMLLKAFLDRMIPVTKAVEIRGMGGTELAVRVLVEQVETFNHVRTIDGERLESLQ